MSQKASAPRERIIPIQVEGRNVDFKSDNNTSTESMDVSGASISSDVDQPTERQPLSNSKEKIILIIDCAEDENASSFKLNNSSQKPLYMIKRSIELFLNLKHAINPQHEYAIVTLQESSAVWELNFTNNLRVVNETLQMISSCEAEDIFDLNSVFDVIMDNIVVPEKRDVENVVLAPPYVVRSILFYGRSYTIPKCTINEDLQTLLDSPYYTLDILMTHEPVDVDNNCDKIFQVLQNIDKKGVSYFFSVSRDAMTLHYSIGKLLGHPLQRPVQKQANYCIKEISV